MRAITGRALADLVFFRLLALLNITIRFSTRMWVASFLLKRTVPPPNLQYVGQSKQGLSVGFEAETSRKSLAGQQGHHPTATPPVLFVKKEKKKCTPRGRMVLFRRVCCSHPLHLTQTICAWQLSVFPSLRMGWSQSLPLGLWGISSGMWTAGRGGKHRAAKQ